LIEENIQVTRSAQMLLRALTIGLLAFTAQAGAESLHVGWQTVDGIELFYREGGPSDAPAIVFLHGNPGSSMQYAEVMRGLAETNAYHVLAMDYPTFGFSAAPSRDAYQYTFDHLAETVSKFLQTKAISRYALFMQDYGVPIGFRLISAAPQSITAIVVQNGVIHLDGFPSAQDGNGELRQHWKNRNPAVDQRRRDYTKAMAYPARAGWEYPGRLAPEFILTNMLAAQRPGIIDARNDLWFDYGTNVARYPQWQALLRKMRVPVLVMWGSHDSFFTTPGAMAYLRDAPQAEIHVLDADHFATLEIPSEFVQIMSAFLGRLPHGSSQ
jgi:pimeloyl-ACP methyl ester carboxylesterase